MHDRRYPRNDGTRRGKRDQADREGADPRARRRVGDADPRLRPRARATTAASGSPTTRATSRGDPDILNLTRPDFVAVGARALPRRRRRHHDHEHLHGDLDRPGRLRARAVRLRDERRRRADRARGRGRPLRRRLGRAAQRHALAEPEGRRPGLPHAHLRPGQGGLRRADARRSPRAASTCCCSRRSSTR